MILLQAGIAIGMFLMAAWSVALVVGIPLLTYVIYRYTLKKKQLADVSPWKTKKYLYLLQSFLLAVVTTITLTVAGTYAFIFMLGDINT